MIHVIFSYARGMRSNHSRDRGDEGRPVGPAFNDAQKAKSSDVFLQADDRYVVRGANSREHIFEPTGELVTSLVRSQKAHQNKLRRGERRFLSHEEFAAFQEKFK